MLFVVPVLGAADRGRRQFLTSEERLVRLDRPFLFAGEILPASGAVVRLKTVRPRA